MGVIHLVIPVLPELRDEIEPWLRSLHIACPEGSGRYPTLLELRAAIDTLTDYHVRYWTGPGHWYADITPIKRVDTGADGTSDDGGWAYIVVANFTGAEADPHEFSFQPGAPGLMLRIVRRLSGVCGPLLLIPDTGGDPVVVTPDLDMDQALRVLMS